MLERHLNVYTLPTHVAERDLAGSTVVVIDLLRATTTICHALAAGATEVVPFREIDETLAAAATDGREKVVLGGERGGVIIDGFDLGNSPAEYTPASVGGRRVFITTTNGTRALHHARLARRVVVGAVVNLSAVVASIKDEPRVDFLCAGTGGAETLEDILAAGAILDRLQKTGSGKRQLNDAAQTAAREWRLLAGKAEVAGRTVEEQLALKLRDTLGGRNLMEVGNEADLPDCAAIDRFDIVPELDAANWRIAVPQRGNALR
jgi:2-phosphosulfolactate phosphatase